MQTAELIGISKQQIQEIFEQALNNFKQAKTRVIYLDASYLYSFHLDDFEVVRRFNMLGRYDINAVKYWHIALERWCNDQTVTLGGRTFKPIAIERTLDRVTNEGLSMIAGCLMGETGALFNYRSIGDGDVLGDDPSPSATTLANEVNRIDVNTTADGGSLSRDGSTLYSVGNHSKEVPTPANDVFTECGMENTDSELTDALLDYSIFSDGIPHTQHADAPGSTTVVYQCSG